MPIGTRDPERLVMEVAGAGVELRPAKGFLTRRSYRVCVGEHRFERFDTAQRQHDDRVDRRQHVVTEQLQLVDRLVRARTTQLRRPIGRQQHERRSGHERFDDGWEELRRCRAARRVARGRSCDARRPHVGAALRLRFAHRGLHDLGALAAQGCASDIGDHGATLRAVHEGTLTSQVLYMASDVSAIPLTAAELEAQGVDPASATPVRIEVFDDVAVAEIDPWLQPGETERLKAALEAAGTKWNFLPFRPGLVGGHCIGVDPYYLTHKAEMLGYHPQVILAGRRINDGMGKYIAEQTIKQMIQSGVSVKGAHINVLGLTFKENCPDLRNSKVIDVIRELESFGCTVHVHDPVAEGKEAEHEYGVKLVPWEHLPKANAIVAAVAHKEFSELSIDQMLSKLSDGGIYVDVKCTADAPALRARGVSVWRL